MKKPASLAPAEAMDHACKALSAGGIGAWELYLHQEQTFNVEVKDQAVESLEGAKHAGMALRLIESGRMGFSYTSDLSPAALEELVARARAAGREVSPDPLFSFAEPDPAPMSQLAIHDSSLAGRPESDKIARAAALESAALAFDPRLKRVRKAEYSETEDEICLWTSEGLQRRDRRTLCLASLGAVAEAGADSQIAWELDFSHLYDKLNVASIGRRAAAKAVGLLGAGPVPSRRCPIVLEPEPAAELLGVLAEAASAEAVVKNRSWLAGKLGQRVASPAVTILDDGRFEDAPDCFPFDGEGERSRRTVVVEDGRLDSFLFDRYRGRQMGAASTGNSRRESFTVPPQVGTSCFFIRPGREEGRALVGQLSRGVLVEQLLGIHLADAVTGEFSVGCVGHLVERGERGAPVSGVVLSGQVGKLFNRVEAVGSDLRFFGEMGSPSLLIGKVALSGK